jgi:hypothetical protein
MNHEDSNKIKAISNEINAWMKDKPLFKHA